MIAKQKDSETEQWWVDGEGPFDFESSADAYIAGRVARVEDLRESYRTLQDQLNATFDPKPYMETMVDEAWDRFRDECDAVYGYACHHPECPQPAEIDGEFPPEVKP